MELLKLFTLLKTPNGLILNGWKQYKHFNFLNGTIELFICPIMEATGRKCQCNAMRSLYYLDDKMHGLHCTYYYDDRNRITALRDMCYIIDNKVSGTCLDYHDRGELLSGKNYFDDNIEERFTCIWANSGIYKGSLYIMGRYMSGKYIMSHEQNCTDKKLYPAKNNDL